MEDIKDRVKTGIDAASGQAKQAVNAGADKAKQATDAAADKAKQAADGAKQGGNGIMDTVREGVQSAVSAVSDAVSGGTGPAYDKAKSLVHDARDMAAKTGDRIQQYASDAYGFSAEHVSDFGKEITNVVKKHPVPALLVGFGLGLLIGRTMSGRA